MDDRRSSIRRTDVPIVVHQCIVTQLGKELWLSPSAFDLSAKGVCLILSDSLNSGESIYLLASVSPVGKTPRDLSVIGVTTQCRPTEGGKWRVGVQFLDMAEFDQAEWTAYLES